MDYSWLFGSFSCICPHFSEDCTTVAQIWGEVTGPFPDTWLFTMAVPLLAAKLWPSPWTFLSQIFSVHKTIMDDIMIKMRSVRGFVLSALCKHLGLSATLVGRNWNDSKIFATLIVYLDVFNLIGPLLNFLHRKDSSPHIAPCGSESLKPLLGSRTLFYAHHVHRTHPSFRMTENQQAMLQQRPLWLHSLLSTGTLPVPGPA